MSYLHVPRLCIQGQFETGGVTANNVLAARDEVNTPAFDPNKNDWHNNNRASNQFWVQDVSRVTRAWDAAGPVTSDPVLGAIVTGDGVMADLDPEQRRVTDLFGCQLALTLDPEREPLLRGTLRPTQLRDLWVAGLLQDDVLGVSTVWQSVMEGLTWSPVVSRSGVLSRLRDLSPRKLSVRLTMTQYDDRHPDQRVGRLLAVLGPYRDGEPEQLVPGRRLLCPGSKPPYAGLPAASFIVDEPRRKLIVDLGNLVPRALKPPAAMLTGLTAKVGGGAIGTARDVSFDDWLANAGLVEWDLTAAQQAQLAGSTLHLQFGQSGVAGCTSLDEHPEGKYVDVDRRGLRLNPGERVHVPVYAWRFGKPLAGQSVSFILKRQTVFDPLRSLGIQCGDPYYPANPFAPVKQRPDDIFDPRPPFSVTTDASGRAELSLRLKPGPYTFPPERKAIDSQLYFLGDPDGWQRWGALGPEVGRACALSVLVFNQKPVPEKPAWNDVARILERYARLYPIMKQVVDLADEAAVRTNAYRIRERLCAPIESVQYMPVTRDLSESERLLIVRYLDAILRTHQGGPQSR